MYHVPVNERVYRDRLAAGVDVKTHYSIAIHEQEGYPWGKDAAIPLPVPNAERNAAWCLSLCMFPELTDAEVDLQIEALRKWDKENR